MEDLLISKASFSSLKKYVASPGSSVALVGNEWLSKLHIAKFIAATVLELPLIKLSTYPHYVEITSKDNKKIGIEEIRKITSVLNLVVPSNKSISRVIVIDNAELMTIEAQNALLKNLEEPPEGTLFILCATSINALLPTIASRVSSIALSAPPKEDLFRHFENEGHKTAEIETAYSMSGGQPGLMQLILSKDDNPLAEATRLAKEMLSGSKLDRLTLVNELAKDKTELSYFFFIIKEMAKIGVKSKSSTSAKRWKHILQAGLESENMLRSNVQAKLTLTNFILSIS
jgi:hypothetical protein